MSTTYHFPPTSQYHLKAQQKTSKFIVMAGVHTLTEAVCSSTSPSMHEETKTNLPNKNKQTNKADKILKNRYLLWSTHLNKEWWTVLRWYISRCAPRRTSLHTAVYQPDIITESCTQASPYFMMWMCSCHGNACHSVAEKLTLYVTLGWGRSR